MKVRQSVLCLALAFALGTSGSAFAQRRAPASGRHAAAVSRQAPPVAVPRTARPGGRTYYRPAYRGPYYRPAYRGPYYRPSYYGPYYRPYYYRSGIGFGIYIGSPYGFYPYPYGYYSYPPPYAYPYPYPGPYGYGGTVVVDPDSGSTAEEAPVTPAQPVTPARGWVAIAGAPADATIYVDGNYAGPASDFTAARPLSEPAGYHEIEIRAPGRRPIVVHLDVQPNRTLNWQYPAGTP
ncbi:MAG: PEGA domain-containing protein [Acidobacteriota bacterium]|nr:PEGA domain-containing protein [Acidobacteriota bacterium]